MRFDSTAYDTKAEAEALLREEKAYFLRHAVCPLMDKLCDRECVCFEEGGVRKAKTKYHLYPWGCSNPMIGQGLNDGA